MTRGTILFVAGSVYIFTISFTSIKLGTPLASVLTDNTGMRSIFEAAVAQTTQDSHDALILVEQHRRVAGRILVVFIQWMILSAAIGLELKHYKISTQAKPHNPTTEEVVGILIWSAVAAIGLFAVVNALILLVRRAVLYITA